ncbi:uncharacterized protein BT62DRAFT_992031 [Guyanagaster necrorhizus]|uniref:F-box domain-containing protein n=1 Tax=Guyanagaster necrorhizus TaxID=856835 RepID=A0A9P7VZV1_9AGAR|nr:uncharacterized protein BT62DRAFT_992031 [Guyanagaster necrorhizus MCA 3950]KAG7449994.1 hypothetical protein BT62DRAFT_992031 [Guyanagaster necrorhizus MCA 3950]
MLQFERNLVHDDDPEIGLSRIQPCCCTFSDAINHNHLIEPTALYLSQACSAWRNIIVSMPKPWSMITIHGANVHYRPLHAKRLLCTYLAHAGQAPLNIRLCEHRRMSLITDLKNSGVRFIGAFNLLFSSYATNIYSVTMLPGLGPLFIVSCPALSHLTVTRPTYWDMVSLALASSSRTISRIDLVDCSVADICYLGSIPPKLTHMAIQNPLHSHPSDTISIPLLVSLTIALSKPHLQPLNGIFETLSLPNLTSLTICAPDLPIDTFIAFLEKSPALRTLTVSSCISDFRLFIAASKNLAVLDIYAHEECLDEIFDVIKGSRRPSDAIVLRMVEKKSDEDEGDMSFSKDKHFAEDDDSSAHVGSTLKEEHHDDDQQGKDNDDEDETYSSEESDEEVDIAYQKLARAQAKNGFPTPSSVDTVPFWETPIPFDCPPRKGKTSSKRVEPLAVSVERTYDSISLAQTPFASEFPIHFLASLQKLFFSPIGWHGLEIHDMLVKAESHIQPFPSAELVQMQFWDGTYSARISALKAKTNLVSVWFRA